jgi:putative transposase
VGQVVRRSAAEKREVILLVEHSALPVGRTLAELAVPCSNFYRWYRQ